MSEQPSPGDTDKSITIVAGEASGDLHAANLIRELKALAPSLSISGMGGSNMKETGADIFIDSSNLAVVGLFEVLAKYRLIKNALNTMKDRIRKQPPDLLILIDYQEFNQKLAAYARSIGIKVLFYIGPQVWAWRPERVHKMAKIVDQMAVIFPFEVELYKRARVKVQFTGHPLVDEVIADKTPQQARAQLGLSEQTTVGIFPGSRSGEITRVLPVMLAAAEVLKQKKPGLQFVLPVASTIEKHELDPYMNKISALEIHCIDNRSYDVMQACDAIMTASGTATLEIGLMGIPMTIVYKISAFSYTILKHMVKLDYIGLVNIVPDREVVREFLQADARPEAIADEIIKILDDSEYNRAMRENLSQLRHQLGEGGGSKNVALLALNMLNNNNQITS